MGEHIRITSPVQSYLERLHAKYQTLRDGEVATYIPELAKADADWFGICMATVDGRLYEVGDTRQPFTIQSISKPLTYGLALEDRGISNVLNKISVEPTGDAFNSISLAPDSGCPLNPMINAGAIAAASLVAGHSADDRFNRLLSVFSLYAGRRLSLDEKVYDSERTTGHRNRAIGHLLRNFDILAGDPELALDLYFKQCSINIDCRDLSLIAATLANGGINPVSGERAVKAEVVKHILSVMTTCGMYDYAGEWVYWVGMPAKSGVGGGVMAVLPGQLGIGVFSPLLDARGNSTRGVAVCRELSADLNLHFLRVPPSARSTIRAHYTLGSVRSKRLRSDADRQRLDAAGNHVRVFELQGDLTFATAEQAVRRVVEASETAQCVILDFRRVSAIEDCIPALFLDLLQACRADDVQLLLASVQQHRQFLRFLEEHTNGDAEPSRLLLFSDLDQALEWCENRLLRQSGASTDPVRAVELRDHLICRGISESDLGRLQSMLERQTFAPGAFIVRKGDPANALYLLSSGEVSVVIDLPSGQRKRLSTLSPGMAFGELAVVNRGPRMADVRADTAVECYVLATSAFDRLAETAPHLKMQILENLLRNVSDMLSRANRELATLSE